MEGAPGPGASLMVALKKMVEVEWKPTSQECVSALIQRRDQIHEEWSALVQNSRPELPPHLQKYGSTAPPIENHEDLEEWKNAIATVDRVFDAGAITGIQHLGQEAVDFAEACSVDTSVLGDTKKILAYLDKALEKATKLPPQAYGRYVGKDPETGHWEAVYRGGGDYKLDQDEQLAIVLGPKGINGLANAVHEMTLDLVKKSGNKIGYCFVDPDFREIDKWTNAFCEGNWIGPSITDDGRIHLHLGQHKAVVKLTEAEAGQRQVELEYSDSDGEFKCSKARIEALIDALGKPEIGLECHYDFPDMTCNGTFTSTAQAKTLATLLPQLSDLDLYTFCDCVSEAVGSALARAAILGQQEGKIKSQPKWAEKQTSCWKAKSHSEYLAAQKEDGETNDSGDPEDDEGPSDEDAAPNFDDVGKDKWWVDIRRPGYLTCEEVYGFLHTIGYYTQKVADEKTVACNTHLKSANKYDVTIPIDFTDPGGVDHNVKEELDRMEADKAAQGEKLKSGPTVKLVVQSPVGEHDLIKWFEDHISCAQLLAENVIAGAQFGDCSSTVSANHDWIVEALKADVDALQKKFPKLKLKWTLEKTATENPYEVLELMKTKPKPKSALSSLAGKSKVMTLVVESPVKGKGGLATSPPLGWFDSHIACTDLRYPKGSKAYITQEQFDDCADAVSKGYDYSVDLTQEQVEQLQKKHKEWKLKVTPKSALDASPGKGEFSTATASSRLATSCTRHQRCHRSNTRIASTRLSTGRPRPT